MVSPSTNVVARSGVPPADDTRHNVVPELRFGEDVILPSSAHVPSPLLPVAPVCASHSVTAAPPVAGTFFNLPLAKNATHRPSGEKNGLRASAGPRIAEGCNLASRRL